jgi:biotin carboxyl carrier protein
MRWIEVEHGGRRRRFATWRGSDGLWIGWPGGSAPFRPEEDGPAAAAGPPRDVRAPMTGRLVQVHAVPGGRVKEGDPLVVLEAMKMEYRLVSPRDGTVKAVHGRPGDRVDLGRVLVELEP